MPRIRTIKPEFWTDEKISKLSHLARLLYIGLWNWSDDYGVVRGNPTFLNSQIFPYDSMSPQKFAGVLTELSVSRLIIPFNSNGESYYFIKTFQKHQVINRKSQNRNPEPPSEILKNDNSLSTQGVLTEDSHQEGKGIGREGNGRGVGREKPTLQEIISYCQERKNNVDPEKFFSHYESNGWKVGRNQMKSWRAAVITWEKSGLNGDPVKKPRWKSNFS